MATADQIAVLRVNVAESTAEFYTDEALGLLIDTLGTVTLASGAIWRQKMARYAELVNVSEAGASRAMSDLFDHAKEMAEYWEGQATSEDEALNGPARAKVHVIQRTA